MEEYIWDAADAMEAELRYVAEEISSRGGYKQSSSSSSSSSRSDSSLNTNNALFAETQDGIDALMRLLLDAQSVSSDMFEQYALKNVFAWPSGITQPTSATTSIITTASELKVAPAPLKLYTAAQETAMDERIAAAEEALNKERRRKRTLLFLRDVYAKRLPQAEQASEALDDLVSKLKGSTGESTPNEDLKSFVIRANRLRDLCERLLAEAPKEVSSAITAAEVDKDEEEEGVDNNNDDEEEAVEPVEAEGIRINSSARTSTVKAGDMSSPSSSSNVRVRAANVFASASKGGISASAKSSKKTVPSTPSQSLASSSASLLRAFDESTSLVGKDVEILGRELTKSARK